MVLEVSWDGLWALSFGLSRCHGHGSWLVCEVALVERKVLKSILGRTIVGRSCGVRQLYSFHNKMWQRALLSVNGITT
jgi:hypothetical protein